MLHDPNVICHAQPLMDIADELRKLALRAAEDPSVLNDLTETDIAEMRRAINPAGGIASTETCYANLSLINFEDNARFNFLMMAKIAFDYRLAKEYSPEPVAINKKYQSAINKATGDERLQLVKLRDAAVKDFHAEQRRIVTDFLDRNYEFNPDIHVRQAKSSGFNDKERQEIQAKIRAAMDAKRVQAAEDSLQQPDAFEKLKRIAGAAYNDMVAARAAIQGCIKALRDPANDIEDKLGILIKKHARLDKATNNLAKVHVPLAAAATAEAYRVQPPADVFHHWKRYIENHYEALNDLSLAFFNEKPDLEYMVTLYSVHHDEKEAEEYRKQHNSDFRAQVDTISSGGSTILGPYKENRERIQYYNQHTELLKAMADKNEEDARLGKDILEKAVQRKKAANIREEGPDRPGLKNYTSSVGMGTLVNGQQVGTHVGHEGAKKVIPHDKMKELEKSIATAKAADAANANDAPSAAELLAEAEASGVLPDAPASASNASNAPSSASSSASAAYVPPILASAAAAASSDASTTEPVGPKIDKRSEQYDIINLEAHFKERPPQDELEAMIMSGTYKINDTDDTYLPPDAVQVQMFAPTLDEDGEVASLTQQYIYTAAEKPLHLEKQSPYAGKYQPVNKTGKPLPVKEAIVTDSRGFENLVHIVQEDK